MNNVRFAHNIINPWYNYRRTGSQKYMNNVTLVNSKGDFSVFLDNKNPSYIYTYKNVAIKCLVGYNEELIDILFNNVDVSDRLIKYMVNSAREIMVRVDKGEFK